MLERTIEKLLFSSRWILAPVYIGLSLGFFVVLAVMMGILNKMSFAQHREY